MLRFTVILGLLCLFQLNIQAQDYEVLDKIIARVGGEILLKSELDENLALAKERAGALPPNAECFILSQLLNQKMLVNQARVDSVEVADVEVESQMNARFEQILNLMGNDPKQFEDYYGMTVSEARTKFKRDMKDQMLAERMKSTVIADVNITPSEVLTFFNAIPQDSLPYFKAEVEVGEIVVFPKPSKEEQARAKAEAQELRKRIVEENGNFAEIASRHSNDPGSARLGGDLGWQKRGQFVPEFEAAAYGLEKGEISEVVETDFGYHIIQMLERLGNRIHTRHILIQPRIQETDLEVAQKELTEVQRLLNTDSISFAEAVKKYSSDKTQSYNNGGLMTNPKTGTTFFETSDLDVDVYFATDTLGVGRVSAPVQILSPTNEVSFKLFRLVSITAPHQASLDQDYSKIKKAAIEEKKIKEMDKWMEKTVKSTHIQLDDQYNGCETLQPWLNRS